MARDYTSAGEIVIWIWLEECSMEKKLRLE
jgi:hypothetical protein